MLRARLKLLTLKGFRLVCQWTPVAQYISAFFVSITRSSRQRAEGTATGLRTGCPRNLASIPGKGPPSILSNWQRRIFSQAVKQPWREAENSPPPLSTEVKNWWKYGLRTLCCMCPWRAHGQIYWLPSISYTYARTISAHTATLQSGIIVSFIRLQTTVSH